MSRGLFPDTRIGRAFLFLAIVFNLNNCYSRGIRVSSWTVELYEKGEGNFRGLVCWISNENGMKFLMFRIWGKRGNIAILYLNCRI